MKFTGSTIINRKKSLVTDLFINPDYLKEYQDEFQNKELLEGEQGQVGAVSKMYFDDGKRKMELIETITKNDLPDTLEAFYHHKHMDNTMTCIFKDLVDNKTEYACAFDYVAVLGSVPKLMFRLFPNVFGKQGEKWMKQFKVFVEQFES
ncbi:MAG: hypothetical protein ACI9JN_000740 [Bacteroidia bacterium]|jgi:hypothetical protein